MVIVGIKKKERQPVEIVCNYNDIYEVTSILEKSTSVMSFNVIFKEHGFIDFNDLNLPTMKKWIKMSFNEYYGEDDL